MIPKGQIGYFHIFYYTEILLCEIFCFVLLKVSQNVKVVQTVEKLKTFRTKLNEKTLSLILKTRTKISLRA